MNILIFNGSPRREGNSSEATKLLTSSMKENMEGINIEVIETNHLKLMPCQGCDRCRDTKGKCVLKDETNTMTEKVANADVLLFVTPVYYWGMTAQMKLAIDKFYCMGGLEEGMKTKQVGVISIGASPLGAIQYELISKQFECIFNYYKWDFIIDESYYAWNPSDIKNDTKMTAAIGQLWKNIKM